MSMPEIKIVNIQPRFAADLRQLQLTCFPSIPPEELFDVDYFLDMYASFPDGTFVALDGEGAGNLHRYARLLYTHEETEFLAVGSALEGLGDVDWQRHTVRRRGAWTLVVDRIVVRRVTASSQSLQQRFVVFAYATVCGTGVNSLARARDAERV